jgi:hypothetical protein
LIFDDRLQRFSLRAKAPKDSTRFERGSAIALRLFVLLLVAYIVFHKIFPFAVLEKHLGELTVGEFLLTIFQTITAIAAAAYFVYKGFRQPCLQDRDRIWCERWSGLAFGVIAILIGSILIILLEKKGVAIATAHWAAYGVLWLLL